MIKKTRQLLFLWAPVVIWCGLIFYLSSIPQLKAASDPFWDEVIRSLLHLIIYAVLFLLFYRAINAFRKEKDYAWALFLSILYSISDEFHQTFVPTRTFELKDLAVNISGILLSGLAIWKLLPRAPKKLRGWAKDFQLV